MHCSFGLALQCSAHPDPRGPDPSKPFGLRQRQGRSSPPSAPVTCRQNLAGRWSAVEWPESKPAGWRAELAAEEMGGLTGAGGSMVA
jgi:hypothetical protein